MQERRTMRAAAIDGFGGVDQIRSTRVAVPPLEAGEVLIRVEWAGVGEWDPFEREGGYARMLGMEPEFPYLLGSEGAGTVETVGAGVDAFGPGDEVYAVGFLSPKGGFYAEYAVVAADQVSRIPPTVSLEQAAVMGGVGTTALRGLDDVLGLEPGESLMVFGASGGVGHLAVQLAKRMGARVFAVASGADGVALGERLGADETVDGRGDDVLAAARRFAPDGFDAALFAAGGPVAAQALAAVRAGGRVAFPNGVQLEPDRSPAGVRATGYNGEPDGEIIQRFQRLVGAGPFQVHVARRFPLDEAAAAHRALGEHYLGKLVLRIR